MKGKRLLSPWSSFIGLEPVVVPRKAESPVFRADVEESQALTDREVALHLASAVGTPVQLLPAVGSVCFTHDSFYSSAMNGYR